MIDCDDVQRFLQPYLDGEIDGEERIFISAHLQSCEACQQIAGFEQAFRDTVRRHGDAPVEAPPQLRERVLRALDAEERPESRFVRWARVAIPAAAAVLLVIGVGISKRGGVSSAAATLADQSIDWHRRDVPMDVTGSSPDTIRRFFSDKVPFAVRPPVFKQARTRTQLVGGRLSTLREHQAAYLVYQVGGRRVSVFIFDASTMRPEGRSRRVGTHDVLWSQRRGYNVAMYRSGGTGYVVASDLEPGQLVQFISSSR